MGVWNLIRRDEPTVAMTRDALQQARRGTVRGNPDPVTRTMETLRDIGLDGKFTFASAGRVAARAKGPRGNPEHAINRVVRRHLRGVGIGGFVTGLGGFLTLPVALPLNVVEFYLQATRTVGAIARLRGYDLNDDNVRAAVMLTLVGEDSREIVAQAGLDPVTSAVTEVLAGKLPKGAMMLVNKGLGFRLLRKAAERSTLTFGRAVPVLGGLVGAAFDSWQLRRIAAAARRDFPPVVPVR